MWQNQHGYESGGFDSGGGYMNSQGDQHGAGGNQNKKTQKTRVQSLLPCTIAQLFKAEQVEDKFVCEGAELNQVSLVGVVRSAHESANNQSYEVDDMTGPFMEVRMFVDNDENTPDKERVPLIPVGTYVSVCGHIRSFGSKRNVSAFKVRKVTDMNEITAHILEVACAHIYLCKGLESVKESSSMAGQNFMSRPATGRSISDNTGMTRVQSEVFNVFKSSIEDRGIAVSTVESRLPSFKQREIINAVEFLLTEGHIYTTFDDDHYKATESN